MFQQVDRQALRLGYLLALPIIWCSVAEIAFCQDALESKALESIYSREERAEQQFLCSWRRMNIPQGATWPLAICDDPNLPFGTARVGIQDWWGKVFEHSRIEVGERLRDKFKSDWLASPEYTGFEKERHEELERERLALIQQRRQAEVDEKVAVERERQQRVANQQRLRAQYDARVPAMNEVDLCVTYHENHFDSARRELVKRGIFTAAEWRLIEQHHIVIGTSELALLCSWGFYDHSNRTVTAHGEREQLVYGLGRYVYVENGAVTAIQDHR
jgi:hypothetical protein